MRTLACGIGTASLSVALAVFLVLPASAAPAARPNALALTTGAEFACALMVTHRIECWGGNDDGRLGDGSTTQRDAPVFVIGIHRAVSISAGWDHACAVLSTGRVKCWGDDTYGQLGDGSTSPSYVPVYVQGILHARTVDAGGNHTCVLVAGGGVKCWGDDTYGQLGDGHIAQEDTPVQVVGMRHHVTRISSGQDDTCAVQAGVAKCWGNDDVGQLGDGGTAPRHVPHVVPGLGSHTTVVNAGWDVTCALRSVPRGQAAVCWGDDASWELGNGSNTTTTPWVDVKGMQHHVSSIAPGYHFVCAAQAGAAKCWGAGGDYQLGDGQHGIGVYRHLPHQVTGLTSGVVRVFTGLVSSYALLADGGVRSWGDNDEGELGTGGDMPSLVPTRVHLQ